MNDADEPPGSDPPAIGQSLLAGRSRLIGTLAPRATKHELMPFLPPRATPARNPAAHGRRPGFREPKL